MKKLIIILFIVLTITMISYNYNSKAAELGTGLEVESPKLWVYIYELSKDAKKFGLNKQLIRSKIELPLRQNDIEVLKEFSFSYPYALNVGIKFLGNEYSGAFTIDLRFERIASYSSGDTTYEKYLISHIQSRTGTATDKNFIMDTLEDQIDIFINEFHKANNF